MFVQPSDDFLRLAQRQLQLNAKLFIRAVRDISAEQGRTVVHRSLNPPHWIVGHVLSNRYYLLAWCGSPENDPYQVYYGDGRGIVGGVDYPSVPDLLETFRQVGPRAEEAVLDLPLESLHTPAPFPLPVAEQTGLGLLAFLLQHESYHVGQLSVIHQLLGHGPIGYT